MAHSLARRSTLAHRAQALAVAKMRHMRHPVEEAAVAALAGVALAFLETKLPMSIAGVPSKPLLVAGAVAIELNSKGRMREAAKALAMAGAGVYGYNAFKTRSLIAGNTVDVR